VDPSQSRAELAAAEERLQRLEQELQELQHSAMRNAERAEAAAKAQHTAAMEFQKSCLAVESGTRKCKELKQQLTQMDSTMTVCARGGLMWGCAGHCVESSRPASFLDKASQHESVLSCRGMQQPKRKSPDWRK